MTNLQLVPETVKVNAPSISSSAMLVELSIGIWEGRKKDRRASAAVTSSNNASRGIATVNKKLLGDCPELEAIKAFVSMVRQWNIRCTLPWATRGPRLLTNAQFFDYQNEETGNEARFAELVEDFLDVYTWAITDVQVKLGNLFDANDYPSVEELRGKFRYDLIYMPLPESGDFRLDTGNQAMEVAQQQLKDQYQTFYTEQINAAMKDLWQRLLEPLKNMSDRLNYEDGERPTGFRDTLVSNVQEIAKLLSTCNVTGDKDMERVRQELVSALRGVTPEALRNDAHTRRKTKEEVDAIIKGLPSLDW